MKISIIIPVYNEIQAVKTNLEKLNFIKQEKEIIIVDDFSKDGTAEFLAKMKGDSITLILNKTKKGMSHCIKKALGCVSGEIVIIQNTGFQCSVEDYSRLIEPIVNNTADTIYAYNINKDQNSFNIRHFLIRSTAKYLYQSHLQGILPGFKAFKIEDIKKFDLHAKSRAVEAEFIAQIFLRKLQIQEIPISSDPSLNHYDTKVSWSEFFNLVFRLIKSKFQSLDTGKETLLRMKLMKNNNHWIFNQIKPYLGHNILEIGSGIGNISEFLVSLEKIVLLSDINDDYLSHLQILYNNHSHVKILKYDVRTDESHQFARYQIDTIVCINVLEHIEEDNIALTNLNKILTPKGRLLLIVPAHKILHGSLDKKLAHFRRYEKNELIKKMEGAGFEVERIFYHNFMAVFGWFLNGRLLKSEIMSSTQVTIFDKLIPLFAKIEKSIRIPFGLSLIAIGKKKII